MFSRISTRLAPIVARRQFSSSRAQAKTFAPLVFATGAIAIACVTTANSDGLNIEAIKKDISNAIDADEEKREDGTSMGPTLIRLAWHAAGTWSCVDKTG